MIDRTNLNSVKLIINLKGNNACICIAGTIMLQHVAVRQERSNSWWSTRWPSNSRRPSRTISDSKLSGDKQASLHSRKSHVCSQVLNLLTPHLTQPLSFHVLLLFQIHILQGCVTGSQWCKGQPEALPAKIQKLCRYSQHRLWAWLTSPGPALQQLVLLQQQPIWTSALQKETHTSKFSQGDASMHAFCPLPFYMGRNSNLCLDSKSKVCNSRVLW